MKTAHCKSFFFMGFLLVALSLTWLGGQAFASTEEKIEVEFLGFGANPDFYGVLQKDKLAGDMVIIYQIGQPAPITSYSLEGTSLKKALASAELSPYGISNKGVEGATASQGYTLTGSAIGAQFQIQLSAGGQSVTLGYVPISSDPTGTDVAKVSIKKVFWTADGLRVVILLNQKLKGEWGMDTDTVAAFALQAPAAEEEAAPAP